MEIDAELTEQLVDGVVTGHAWFWKTGKAKTAFDKFMKVLKKQNFETLVKDSKHCYMVIYQKGGQTHGVERKATRDFEGIEEKARERADSYGSPSPKA